MQYIRDLRDLFKRTEPPVDPEVQEPTQDDGGHIAFHDLGRRLMSPSQAERHDAALMVATFLPAETARPLVRAYVHTGDRALLEAVRAYGPRLTHIVAREALDFSLAPSHRGRLMEILGATGDPSARRVLREASKDLDRTVRVAASAALAELGDTSGLTQLNVELLSNDAMRRARALEALRHVETEPARLLATEHAERYLAEGGAVPADVGVTLPVLIDPDTDMVSLLAEMTAVSKHWLTLVTGPGTGRLSDLRRADFSRSLAGPERVLYFTTDRHSHDEQRAVLEEACAAASSQDPRRVVLFGPLPSPGDAYPSADLLPPPLGQPYSAQLIFVGPHKFQPVMEWCVYLRDACAVPAQLHVVLTDLRFGGEGRIGDEELAIQAVVDALELGERPDAFARAYLARLREGR